jgi:hypothetical protein
MEPCPVVGTEGGSKDTDRVTVHRGASLGLGHESHKVVIYYTACRQ